MEGRAKNRGVIKELVQISNKNNKARSRILIGAAALSVFLLFGAFSIVNGRIEAEVTSAIREKGTLASITLPDSTKEQYEQIQKLDYIEAYGRERIFAEWIVEETGEEEADKEEIKRDETVGDCVVAGEGTFEAMDAPAFTAIHGTYPQKADEIMMPVSVLKELGITKPKIGMKIPGTLDMGFRLGITEDSFYLSGYYTEYADPVHAAPNIYFSEKYLMNQGMKPFEGASILMRQKDTISGEDAEKSLYEDVQTKEEGQQFEAEDTPKYQVMEEVVGGYLIASFCIVVILLSVYLLSFNVLSISMNREIRQYGLLKVAGTTNKQLMQMIYRQGAGITLKGCVIGTAISLLFAFLVLPDMLARLYMAGMGSAEGMQIIKPLILILAVCFTAVTMLTAVSAAGRKVKRLSEIEAVRYIERPAPTGRKRRESKEGASIFQMAWRNITGSRKRFAIVLLSLFLGLEMAAGAVMIASGTDITHKIEQNPDFEITNQYSIWGFEGYVPDTVTDDKEISTEMLGYLPRELVEEIEQIDGIESIDKIQGSYAAIIDYPEELIDAALAPRLKAVRGTKYFNCYATLHIVDEEEIQKLDAYTRKEGLAVDIDSLRDGTGTLLLHNHVMTPALDEEAEAAIGQPVHFQYIKGLYYSYGTGWWYDELGGWNDGTRYDTEGNVIEYETSELKSCGYLDIQKKEFPDIPMTWNGKETNYFIMTQEAFDTLGLEEKVFGAELDVDPQKEPQVKEKLEGLLAKMNTEHEKIYGTKDIYSIVSKSDTLAKEKGRIDGTRYAMGVLAGLLIFAGVMNYMNTMLTQIASRKREFAVMEGVGMTRRQLRNMLLYEGICYMAGTAILLFTAGYALLWGVGKLMKENLSYFTFRYPWEAVVFMLGVFCILCIGIALYSWRQYGKTELADALRSGCE